ncbi:MAG: hypothetical protein PHC60_07395 [Heliobacteriaceae bacterium]|nr:hypothetical protein [Heliobacteriaceae bacterium]MDD4588195.1 hypothetical protein [Heliobacteriaceae bacterium]
MPDRLKAIFSSISDAFNQPVAEKIRFDFLNWELSSTAYFVLALLTYFLGGMVFGYLLAKHKYTKTRNK